MFNALATWAQLVTADIEFSKKTYKLKISIKNEKVDSLIKAEILKIPEQDIHCIEFTKIKGEYLDFIKQY